MIKIRELLGRFLFLIWAVLPTAAVAEECRFSLWQNYKGTSIFRHSLQGAYLYRSDHAAVDADGAPNAYHPADVTSYSCSMRQLCPGAGKGLDCPQNAGYPCTGWWGDVLAVDPDDPNRALIQQRGKYEGYFVSKTSLFDPFNQDLGDPARYVNAVNIPYIVFPRSFYAIKGTGKLGDVGVAYHRGTGKTSAFVVADIGPTSARLGEGSIALFQSLGFEDANPRNGGDVAPGEIIYVVFPYSVHDRAVRWPVSSSEISAQAEKLLSQFGGGALFDDCSVP